MALQPITSRKNPAVLDALSLRDKKKRDETNSFYTEGVKLFGEARRAGLKCRTVFVTERAAGLYAPLIRDVQGYLVTDEVYDKLTEESAPQGLLAVFEKPDGLKTAVFEELAGKTPFLIADGVQNPANLGAMLRSAFCFGFTHALLSDDCADVYAAKTLRASMGLSFGMKIGVTDSLSRDIGTLISHGAKVYATALHTESKRLCDVSFGDADCFAVGNEGHGVSDAVLAACSDTLYIPMNPDAESLNASAAAAVVMWEMRRDRL